MSFLLAPTTLLRRPESARQPQQVRGTAGKQPRNSAAPAPPKCRRFLDWDRNWWDRCRQASAGAAVVVGVAIFGTTLAQSPTPAPSTPRTGQVSASGTANAKLAVFQDFVNGDVPVKEAVVYRKISKPDGTIVNQEWWRFGYQENTWYAQRLQPATNNPPNLVPLWDHEVCGASFTHLWIIDDRNIHVAAKQFAAGSIPDSHGGFPRNLMFCALSLGLPRRLDQPTIRDAPIEWDGLEFRTVVGSKRDPRGAVLASSLLEGKLALGENGLPASAEYPSVGQFPGGSVTYEYRPETQGVPAIFTHKGLGREYRYEFVSLELGTNDLTQTEGYVPSLFADLRLDRHITVWTNDKDYSLIHGKLDPAFGARHIVGEHPKRSGPMVLISLAAASATILALWYRRSEKEKQTKEQKHEV